MNFPFYKLKIGGNDLLLINLIGEVLPDEVLLPGVARAVCRRRRGIGANGVIFLFDHTEAGAQIRFFSRKGKELRRFHDPLFCAARYLFDSGFAGTSALTLATHEGIRTVEAIDSANFRLSLGKPYDAQGELLREMIDTDRGSFLSLGGKTRPVTPVLLDQFWGVLFISGDPQEEKKALGKAITEIQLFKRSFHPLFVQIYSDDDIAVAIQRGRGQVYPETSLAAGAAAVATAAQGFANRSLLTRLGGYELFVEWREQEEEILCTAGAEYIFTGDYYFDEEGFYKSSE